MSNEQHLQLVNNVKKWCKNNNLNFVKLSKDGERIIAINPAINSDTYSFTLYYYKDLINVSMINTLK